MADSPLASQQVRNKPERNPNGTLKKGSTANPGGRPSLDPMFVSLLPAAQAMLAAAAVGVVLTDLLPEGDEGALAACQKMATDAPLPLRIDAAHKMLDRGLGKAKESLEIDATSRTIREVVLRVVPAPSEKPVVAAPKSAKSLPR